MVLVAINAPFGATLDAGPLGRPNRRAAAEFL